jgi:hypothetical protein
MNILYTIRAEVVSVATAVTLTPSTKRWHWMLSPASADMRSGEVPKVSMNICRDVTHLLKLPSAVNLTGLDIRSSLTAHLDLLDVLPF